ncbi:MAG: DUF6056 family protein [Clostridia bacterium]|nr:DUF6056 family protein [Clostridia bacterium]
MAKIGSRLERFEARASVRRVLFIGVLLLTGALVYGLNLHTPLMMDDYDYSFSWKTGQPLSGIADVFSSQAEHYRLWGGRSVAHTLAQLFLFWGKPVFNAANAAMYLLLLMEIVALARRERGCWDYALLLPASVFLLFGVPFFATVFLWLDGACNYLWCTVLALTPLLIDRSEREGGAFSRGGALGVFAVPVSFLAGWTNENTACAVWAIVFLMLMRRRMKGERVPFWRWAALAAQAAGTLVMLAAPGNFARASEQEQRSLLSELTYRFAVAGAYSLLYVGALLALMLALSLLARKRGVHLREWAVWLLGGAVLVSLALVASPLISDRSFTGTIVLTLAAALCMLSDLYANARASGAFRLLTTLPLLALFVFAGTRALDDVKTHEATWLAQVACAQQAREAGEERAYLSSVPSHSRFTMDISLAPTPDEWPNSTLSRAFGIQIFSQ